MIAWRKQGAALIAPIRLADGAQATMVLVGAATQAKGAVIVVNGPDDSAVEKIPLKGGLDRLTPAQAIEVLCMQERAFGTRSLTPPELT